MRWIILCLLGVIVLVIVAMVKLKKHEDSKVDEKEVYEAIFLAIQEKLENLVEDAVFKAKSYEQLGAYYYKYILNNVDGATVDRINKIVAAITHLEGNLTQSEYYKAIVEDQGIKILPALALKEVEARYDEVFINQLNAVRTKYNQELTKISTKKDSTDYKIEDLKNRKAIRSFVQDMTTEEQELYRLCLVSDTLRTRIDMLKCAEGVINDSLSEFCDSSDSKAIDIKLREQALRNSREEREDFRKAAFSWYSDYLEIWEDDIERDYSLFFKIKRSRIVEKAYSIFNDRKYKSKAEAENAVDEYLALLPSIDDLHDSKENDVISYNDKLKKMIADYEIMPELLTMIDQSVCLRRRAGILKKALELYQNQEFELFNNVVPVQIEGMFADYLQDATTFSRFDKQNIHESAVLKSKITALNESVSPLYPEVTEYFGHYFNNLVRNKVAHGRYYGSADDKEKDEAFASELLLDLNYLVHYFSTQSELDKMHEFITRYKEYYSKFSTDEEIIYRALYNDITGKKLISRFCNIESYRPIQVVYWLLNPYYENVYSQVEDVSRLQELRAIYTSKAYWEFVLEELRLAKKEGWARRELAPDFQSIIKGMFNVGVDGDTKKVLASINAEIQSF